MSADKKRPKLEKEDLRTFVRLISFAKPYWPRLLIGAACSLMSGGSIVAILISGRSLLGFIFDNNYIMHAGEDVAPAAIVETAEAAPAPEFFVADSASAPDDVAVSGEETEKTLGTDFAKKIMGKTLPPEAIAQLEKAGIYGLISLCLGLMVIIIVNSLATFASMYYLPWVGHRVVMDLRVRVFAHLQKLSVAFYNSSRAGDMISRTVSDTQVLQQTVSNVITDMIRQPVMFVTMLSFILITEWHLALISLVIFPTVVVPIILIGKRLRKISREGQRRLADLTSVMKESLDGVMVVKAFGQESREEKRFTEQCRGFFRRMVSATKAKALNDPITHIIGGLGGIGVLIYSVAAQMPLEECIIFACAIWALYEPIKKMGRISMEIQQSSAAADRVFEILDAPITVADAPGARPVDTPLETITFKDVSFGYGERDVFTNMNFTIHAGESLAVVGPSGGGKTTLVSLLLRFFEPQSGSIRRNGIDYREYTIESVRANIGFVMQDTFLFNATIAENIAYGKPDATREEIEHAARLAHAHEFIVAKEDGYETMVGERGVSLSGGQKQRLAIARALIRNPPVLILDEATSALDTESERHVQAAIDELMEHLTVIIIAHRLSTIAKCKHIAVIADGGVAEYGTQAELLAKNGIYTKLHNMQFESRSLNA